MKYQILLAEDEEDVRKTIAQSINDSDMPYEVVGEAADGIEAIEMMRTLNPDILITDVCMPHLNGLAMLKGIREFNPDIPTVIISGYDEFSYVREALHLGVREYLLKPFLPRELFDILDKIRMELERQSQLQQNLEGMSQQLQQTRELSREHFVRRMLDGGAETELEQCAEQIDFPLNARCYVAGVLRFTTGSGGAGEKLSGDKLSGENMQQYLDIIKDNYFSPELTLLEGRYGLHQLVLFFAGGKTGSSEFVRLIQEGMEKIIRSMEHYHGIGVQCTLGEVYREYQGLLSSYGQALDTWKKMISPDMVFLKYRDAKVSEKYFSVPEEAFAARISELEGYLLFHAETNHLQGALEELDKLFDIYAEFPMEKSEYVNVALTKLVLKLSDLISKAGDKMQAWEDETILNFLRTHFLYGSLQEAKAVLAEYIGKCCSQFAMIHENQRDRMIYEAKSLIQQNLANEEFGLEQLAAMLHFSPNYVRQVFKAQAGENFTDYLFRSRMEMAEQLLKNPTNKIQDVALQTGYSNQRYFARCFKKYFICTPTEYRERIG